jgi:amino acid transporter
MQSSKISVTTATLIGINSMIGAGIFSAPAVLASFVGPAGLLTYVIVILGVWCMAFSFGILAQLFPEEGAFYTYAKQWGGHRVGLFASTAYLIGILTSMGLLTKLAGIYLHTYFPNISMYILGLSALTALVLLNMAGGIATRITQVVSICCTAIPLAVITLLCLSKANMANLTPFAPYGFTNVFRAMQEVIFGFFGFESTIALYGIVEQPQKNVPRALSYAIIFVSAIYFLFIASIFLAIPTSIFTSAAVPLSAPLEELFPDKTWLINIIHAAITISFLSVINAVIWATSTLFISLTHKFKSKQGKAFAHSKKLTPATSVLLMGAIIATVFTLFNDIKLFFTYASLFIMFAFIASLMSLYKVRSKLSMSQQLQAVVGTLTACLILCFAVERLISIIL